MKIMSKLTIKNLFRNKKNFILCFISVLLSCILLFSVGLAVSTFRQNQINNLIDNYGDYHAIIYNTNINEKNKLNDERVLKYFYIFQIKDNLYGISDDFSLDIDLKGKMPTNNKEIIINNETSMRYDLKIGDNFNIAGKDYQVVGIYTKNFLYNLNLKNVIFTKEEENNNNSLYFIYLKSYKNIYNNIRDIANDFDNSNLYINNNVLYPLAGSDPANVDTNDNTTAIYFLMTMFLCLILAFIVFFIIYNAFSISVNEKKKSYAMYKSIGASPKQILFSVFLETLIILGIAIPLGFLLSLGFVALVLLIVNNTLTGIASHIYTLEIYPLFIFVSLIFILVSTLFATFSVAKMASSINIIEEVRQTKKFKYKKERKLIKKLFGITGAISAKSVTRDRAKYRITTISIVIGIILFLTTSSLLNIVLYSIEISPSDKYIRLQINKEDYRVIDEVISLASVDDYLYSDGELYLFETDNKVYNFNDNYLSVEYLDSKSYQSLRKQFNITNDSPMIIGNYINSLESTTKPFFEDEIINLKIYNTKNNYVADYQANVIEDYGDLTKFGYYFSDVLIPTLVLELKDMDMDYLDLLIISDKYLEFDKEIQPILNNYPNISYTNTLVIMHDDILTINCVKLVIYLALGLIVFITVVSIIGTISANLNLRRREFAVLKSLGLSNKQFNKMIFYESLMLSLKSLLFGLLIFILIATIFIRITMINESTFKSILDIPLNIFIPSLLICIIGVIIINYFAFLIATRKIKKDNIVDVIKTY